MPIDRYHRQALLPEIGPEGQARLEQAHAAVVGVGALGCTAADLLARAGVGTITLVDRDLVERTNLQRQSLFDEHDAAGARPKAIAAADRLGRVNAEIRLRPIPADLNAHNAERLLGLDAAEAPASTPRPTVLIDGTDNFETRYLLNDIAVAHQLPFVYGGAIATRGMSMVLLPERLEPEAPCLRCLFPSPPAPGTTPTCDTAGVLGAVVSIVGGVQAAEAMKLMVGDIGAVSRSLLEFDLWHGLRRRLSLEGARRDDCPCCRQGRFEFLDAVDAGPGAARLCGQRAVQVWPSPAGGSIDLEVIADRLRRSGTVELSPSMLRARLPAGADAGSAAGAFECTLFGDGRAIIRGTEDPALARSLYARYIGS